MLEDELRNETIKWLKKIEKRLEMIDGDGQFLSNIRAYISDTTYFLQKSDLIRAFECVVWAWAWLEIGLEVGKLQERSI
jgi:hypothetical protein